jgi:hypothetical protein
MATDNTEPRDGLIIKVGVVAIVTVVVLRVALGSYFDRAIRTEELHKVGEAAADSLAHLRASEAQRLSAGAMPIAKAMDEWVKHGRTDPELAPSASHDLQPLQGWIKMPADVPLFMSSPPPPVPDADAGADSGPAGDAGGGKRK